MCEDVRIIEVTSCAKCPFKHFHDGAGHCAGFTTCRRFRIMLHDWDGPENFDVHSGIHPECKLEKQIT